MATTWVVTPGAAPYLTQGGTAVANLVEVFLALRVRPSQTVESGVVSSVDLEMQLEYTYYLASDLNPILLQGGVVGGASNPLSAAGISPNATGIHRPVRRGKPASGDTVTVTIGGQSVSFVVGTITANAADALGQSVYPDVDTAISLRPAP